MHLQSKENINEAITKICLDTKKKKDIVLWDTEKKKDIVASIT